MFVQFEAGELKTHMHTLYTTIVICYMHYFHHCTAAQASTDRHRDLPLILYAGNHDVTLDSEFYAKNGHIFHGQKLEDPKQCIDIVTGAAPSVVLLRHQATTIHLTRGNGPRTTFTVFGSPFSQFKGSWAFGYESSEAVALWDQIPPNVDIVVTHTPPQSLCDQKPDGSFAGCNSLRQTLSRIRPPLAICGHVHEGRGYRRVRWGDASIMEMHPDEGVETGDRVDRVIHGALPPRGSKKLNLVDLTGKRGDRLDSHSFACETSGMQPLSETSNARSLPLPENAGSAAVIMPDEQRNRENASLSRAPFLSTEDHCLGYLSSLRKETCVVNAAIMATSWPHRGGKQFNAPMVVDIELPEWCPRET